MVDNTSIMAHRDAELEGGGDHLIDRLLDGFSLHAGVAAKLMNASSCAAPSWQGHGLRMLRMGRQVRKMRISIRHRTVARRMGNDRWTCANRAVILPVHSPELILQ